METPRFFITLVVSTILFICVAVALIALRLAEQASNRADKLGAKMTMQQETINTQEQMLRKMLDMSDAHQDLIEGILDNQVGIVDLVAKRSKQTRLVANTKP